MLVTALPQVMRSHLQFGAVLDNAVIRLEMQKSSLKLNNIFVTVLRGADCLEPCWSLDLEYFGVVLAIESVTITLERPTGGVVVGDFGTRLQALAVPGCIVWHQLVFAALAERGRAPGTWTWCGGTDLSPWFAGAERAAVLRRSGPCLAPHVAQVHTALPRYLRRFLVVRIRSSLGEKVPSHLLEGGHCLLLSNM